MSVSLVVDNRRRTIAIGSQGFPTKVAAYTDAQRRSLASRFPLIRRGIKDHVNLAAGASVTAAQINSALVKFKTDLDALGNAYGVLDLEGVPAALGATVLTMQDRIAIRFDPNHTVTHSGQRFINGDGKSDWSILGFPKVVGPLSSTGYAITMKGSQRCKIELKYSNANSGIQLQDAVNNEVELWITESRGTGLQMTGFNCTKNRVRFYGRNLANFGVHITGGAWGNVVEWVEKTTNLKYLKDNGYLDQGDFFDGQVERSITASDEDGAFTTSEYLGEEIIGMTETAHDNIVLGGYGNGVGDNAVSVTGYRNHLMNVVVESCKHDGFHAYGFWNNFINCTARFMGKYDATGEDVVNGYGFSARPNAGGCAFENTFINCVSEGNRKGDFNAGDAALYRPWVAGSVDTKRYCYVTVGDKTLTFTGSGSVGKHGTVTPGSYGFSQSRIDTLRNSTDTVWVDANLTATGTMVHGALAGLKSGGNTSYYQGSCTLAAAPLLTGWQAGTYTLRCTVAAAGGGTFVLKDPSNATVATYAMSGGTLTTSAQVATTITAGAVDYAVGDGFDIVVGSLLWVDGGEQYAVATKSGGNTGNGTCAALTYAQSSTGAILSGYERGVYQLRCTVAGQSATFTLTSPTGTVVGTYSLPGTASGYVYTTDHLGLKITDGSTNFAVGDGFDITISALTWQFNQACPAGKGPFAYGNRWIGCKGDHPTRKFYQDPGVPKYSHNGLGEYEVPEYRNPPQPRNSAFTYCPTTPVTIAGTPIMGPGGFYFQRAGGGATMTRVTGSQSPYAVKMQRNNLNASANTPYMAFELSGDNLFDFLGQLTTIRFRAKCGANWSDADAKMAVRFDYLTGTPADISSGSIFPAGATEWITQTLSLTTDWQELEYELELLNVATAIPANATQLIVYIYFTPVGTAGTDDSITIECPMLFPSAYTATWRRESDFETRGRLGLIT